MAHSGLDRATISRRGMLLSAPLLGAAVQRVPSARAGVFTKTITKPILDQPMQRLRLPQGAVGRDYILLQLKVAGKGPFDFMVDTGLTAELITPHLRNTLGIGKAMASLSASQGLAAGGAAGGGADLVQLKGVSFAGASEDVRLPPLTAVVMDFLQEHIDPAHDPVEGMLGMELLTMFDVDFDFPAKRIRLYRPGEGVAAATAAGLVDVPAAVLNETGVLGIRATTPKAKIAQPFVGVLDCGASFSAMNWQAAALAGLPPQGDKSYKPKPGQGQINIVGVDGKPQALANANVSFTFLGNATEERGKIAFKPPPSGWKPWQPVQVGVGDLPIFTQLLGDGRSPYQGPAALIGLDVLSQRRVVIGAGTGKRGRERQLLVSKA